MEIVTARSVDIFRLDNRVGSKNILELKYLRGKMKKLRSKWKKLLKMIEHASRYIALSLERRKQRLERKTRRREKKLKRKQKVAAVSEIKMEKSTDNKNKDKLLGTGDISKKQKSQRKAISNTVSSLASSRIEVVAVPRTSERPKSRKKISREGPVDDSYCSDVNCRCRTAPESSSLPKSKKKIKKKNTGSDVYCSDENCRCRSAKQDGYLADTDGGNSGRSRKKKQKYLPSSTDDTGGTGRHNNRTSAGQIVRSFYRKMCSFLYGIS